MGNNMSTAEIVLNMLAEVSTTEISKAEKPSNFDANRNVAQKGGKVAGQARENLERQTGKSIITNQNAIELKNDI